MKLYLKKMLIILIAMLCTAIGIVFMRQANIGLDPWNVLSQGIEKSTALSFGMATNLASFIVMIIALLLGEGIGLGTLGNVFALGIFVDLVMNIDVIPQMTSLLPGLTMLVVGMEFTAFGTYLYMSTCTGEGPRDSLMIALAKHTRIPVGACRVITDGLVTICGWLLGGSVGIGTIITAFGIGSLIHLNLKIFKYDATSIHQENLAESIRHCMRRN